ncbi:DNA polymerase III PolC-type [Oxobacter pfennigii]|uniref:DNA polymerase III PolC-type n=1 Tax=Oxobacter pfennigii TaxID=36849 RepID=A0A0P8W755_9CLOT|nr:PolC-type DNA polymerase III [Oxobacter pfennigii]KPU43907.1 DNA polymerase III PolC-type [Oxobacter pfennigii]
MTKALKEFLKGIEIEENLVPLVEDINIEKVSVNKKDRSFNIYVKSTIELHSDAIKSLCSIIRKKYGINETVDIIPIKKPAKALDMNTMDSEYFEDIIKYVSLKVPMINGSFKNVQRKIEANDYILILENKFSYDFLTSKGCHDLIREYIKENYGIKVNIKLDYKEDLSSHTEYFAKKQEEDKALLSDFIKNTKNSSSAAIKEDSKSPLILGKKTDDFVIPIKEVNDLSGRITIEGDIFDLKIIETKTGRTIISFNITDYTSSITVKAFPNEKTGDALKERLKVGLHCKVRGEASFDKYSKETTMIASDIEETKGISRMDDYPEKRVELHLHTQMSSMDGVSDVSHLIKTAAKWGHKAVAITDHGVVQAFPEAAEAAAKYNIKVLYGVEAYMVDDGVPIVYNSNDTSLDCEFVVFDIETTGLSSFTDKITEIGAVKIKEGQITDSFSALINPGVKIPRNIVELTGIDDEMVKDKPPISVVLPEFLSFIGDAPLVAHNAKFDVGFIKQNARKLGAEINNPVVDTLTLSRMLFPELKKHKLDVVAKHLGIKLENHHRAVDDSECTGRIFLKCLDIIKEKGASKLKDINSIFNGKQDYKKADTYHTVLIVKNYEGLLNLYKLISISHLNYYYRRPRILKSLLMEYKEGLIIGSGCEAGLLFREVLRGASDSELADIVRFYDYLEIQPIANNEFLVRENRVQNEEELKNINKRIVDLGIKYKKPVVATGDVHFLNPEDEVYRRILMSGQGFEDADKQAPLYLKTTREMMDEFSYLGKEYAYDVVIKNPNLIADMVEVIKPIPDETFTPKIDGADDEIRKMTMDRAHEIYGENLPEIVVKRLDKELNSIINNGYAVLYLIAQKLVHKSVNDGYLVGSRGSVGSSFVATMCGITEVNPLPPHYVCKKCKHSEFITDGSIGSGADLEDKICPNCGEELIKEGHDIPFEVFLGFEGDKEPDIDLNFSGDYQPVAHRYTEELFGKGHVFRAGTIGTIADKTAYGFVKNYLAEKNIVTSQAEVERLTKGCTGVKRTTGQHPGGVMVVPRDNEIYQFTPVQHPADDSESDIITTHFDYHSISGRLLKLDILGHDDPTVIKMLQDLTGIDPTTLPLGDERVIGLFTSPEPLGIKKGDINCEVGTLGLPEFGTKFVRQMLVDTKPKTFAELVRISGLSHGTDVWLNNAQDLIRSNTATLKEVICTRDDIMLYLMYKGVKPKSAFNIMERVRKGKGLRPEDMEEMKANDVPQWYIDSCNKIKYMFPKGHAVAYVMMAIRIAYFKVYYPLCYYAAYFSIRADEFDADIITKGEKSITDKIKSIEAMGNEASQKDKGLLTILEIALEMHKRGFSFCPVDLYKSDAVKFLIEGNSLIPPLNSLQGLGEAAARSIMESREKGNFISIEDLRNRAKVSKTVIEILKNHGCLRDMPESNQLTLF